MDIAPASGETDLSGSAEEEWRDTNEEMIRPRICLGLLSVMWRENKLFSLDSFDSDQHAL